MKKNFKKLFSLLSILIVLSSTLVGCSSTDTTYEKKQYSMLDIDNIEVDIKDRKIEIFPSSDKKIHISYYDSEKEYYMIDLFEKNRLSIKYITNKGWSDYIGGKTSIENRTIKMWIPNESLENLNLKTSNGDIEISQLSFLSSVDIKVSNGNIELKELDARNSIELETKNGNIGGTLTGSYDDFFISNYIKKGKSNLPNDKHNGSKKLTTYTNNGDILLDFIND
ncbi:hypothetical protein KW95_09980 [Clostridioides difficile]|nr:hypothetical protein KW95_09980 [Clostridioides difficile]MDI7815875.1 DUF4097 family beta strand repeat-containing protein [Clostridioides difficile]